MNLLDKNRRLAFALVGEHHRAKTFCHFDVLTGKWKERRSENILEPKRLTKESILVPANVWHLEPILRRSNSYKRQSKRVEAFRDSIRITIDARRGSHQIVEPLRTPLATKSFHL